MVQFSTSDVNFSAAEDSHPQFHNAALSDYATITEQQKENVQQHINKTLKADKTAVVMGCTGAYPRVQRLTGRNRLCTGSQYITGQIHYSRTPSANSVSNQHNVHVLHVFHLIADLQTCCIRMYQYVCQPY